MLKENEMHQSQLFIMVYFLHRMNLEQQLWGRTSGFPLDLENLEKWEYTWKTWKYHGILKNLINIMEKWHETWKNLVATKNSPLTPLKQYKIH